MRKFVLAAVLVLMASGAQAATLDVVGGQLHGAFGVNVDGSLYDVEFLDGTCIDLYSGCDDVSDFTFQTSGAALLAAHALLDQVFLDGAELFDTDPGLTRGCAAATECFALNPHRVEVDGADGSIDFIQTTESRNNQLGDVDTASFSSQHVLYDTATVTNAVYAVWTPVPEPGTAVLMGLGPTGLAAKGRRSLRS